MVSETEVSTAALVVALVALVTTVSQVLGQFFATAEGYRRCQPSVMGGWAKFTRRKFRWSELRFETIYTVPRFGIYSYLEAPMVNNARKAISYHPLDGSTNSLKRTNSKLLPDDRLEEVDGPDNLVSWVRFIEALHANSAQTLACSSAAEKAHIGKLEVVTSRNDTSSYDRNQGHTIPIITPQKRSWDFVPPEVIRPLAVISIGDIAILARRLGLVWKNFDPSAGLLQAEGNGHTLSSTTVRSVGTVLEISIREKLNTWNGLDELYVPSYLADKLGFGILPGQESMYVPHYRIGTEEQMKKIVSSISTEALDHLENINNSNPGWTPGISDIIGMAAPMIRLRGSSIMRVPQPSGYAIGLTQQEDGFVVFHNRLKHHITEKDRCNEPVSKQSRLVLHQYEELLERYGKQWESQHHCKMNKTSIAFLDDLDSKRTATTQYFIGLQTTETLEKNNGQRFRFIDLMYSHITHAINYFPVALDRIRAQPSQARETYGLQVADWIIEGSHVYFDNIPKVVASMKERGFDNPELVEEAWITLMFRAFLWHRSHHMVQGERVPSAYWNSRLPVYIG